VLASAQDTAHHRQDAENHHHADIAGSNGRHVEDRALTFLTNDYGRPFASAAAFGNKFADWCREAGLEPVMCEDGKVRNYRAHGLRKASLRALAHAKCTAVEMMHVSGHSSMAQLQEYLEEVEQEEMADSAISKVVAASR